MPMAALRPICGFPCKVRSVEHQRFLSLQILQDATDSDDTLDNRRQTVSLVLRTTGDRKQSCELVFNGILAGPNPPDLWGWNAISKEHGVVSKQNGETWAKQGAEQGWIMMIRHGLSVANVQKDTFKGSSALWHT